jgi:hypothetical protein
MRDIQRVGPYVDIVEGRSPADPSLKIKLGLGGASFQQNLRLGLATYIAQYYGVVQDCMLNAVHLFRGLKRPLMDGDDEDADKNVLVFSWRPDADFVWEGSRFDGHVSERIPPLGRVFVVLVRPESQLISYPGVGTVFGSIEKWNWVKEDPSLAGAPVDWNQRYDKKLWSR